MTDKTIQQIILTPEQIEAMKGRLEALGRAVLAAEGAVYAATRDLEDARLRLNTEATLAARLGVEHPLFPATGA